MIAVDVAVERYVTEQTKRTGQFGLLAWMVAEQTGDSKIVEKGECKRGVPFKLPVIMPLP